MFVHVWNLIFVVVVVVVVFIYMRICVKMYAYFSTDSQLTFACLVWFKVKPTQENNDRLPSLSLNHQRWDSIIFIRHGLVGFLSGNFFSPVVGCKIVAAGLFLRYTYMLLGHYAPKKEKNEHEVCLGFFFFFFFWFPSYISGVHPLLGEIFAYVTVF